MGEVYRARDTKLGRDVALKVLPSAFAADPERLARLEREARLLASLNHPNIAHVYGLEESNDLRAVVMELVEGETLADRLKHGAIPLKETLAIARQICEALEAAHEHGIIHRDLKPANIKVRPDGTVKVLDFGLAKIVTPDSADVINSPTLTAQATQQGLILGTTAYMSPEQATGKPVDRRTDLWSFGVVLMEMLTGRRVFAGETASHVIAAVLKTEPDWTTLPVDTPASVRRLVRRCLDKDPRRRLESAADARIEIEDALAGAAEVPPISHGDRGTRWRVALPWSILAVLGLAALGAALYLTTRPRPVASGSVTRLEIRMPPGVDYHSSPALSPDGRRVAFVGAYSAGRQVYVRELDQLEADPLRITAANVDSCFFSPDGRELGFNSQEHVLKRVTLSDVATPPLERDVTNDGGSWGPDGQLTFIRAGELWQVPATGGTLKQLTRLDRGKGEVAHRSPAAVGDGQLILFEVRNRRSESHIEAVSAATGARHLLEESGRQPSYASSGYLLFLQGTDLLAAPFDADRVMTTAPAVRVLQNVDAFSVSRTGSLLYSEPSSRRLVWVSREGIEEPIGEARRGYAYPALSPNGDHVAVELRGVGGVWDQDLVRGTLTPLGQGNEPIWTRDGTHVIVGTSSGMKWVDTGGGEPARPIAGSSSHDDYPGDVTRKGMLAFSRVATDTQADIYVLSLDGRVPPQPVVQTEAYEAAPQISPNEQLIAFVSDKSGTSEIYASPFPGFDRYWQVSTHGGTEPRWSRDGRELFYRRDDRMMSVRLSNDPANLFPSQPVQLWEHPHFQGRAIPQYDVAKDGRFLMIRNEPGSSRLIVVVNWIEELKARMAAGK
jgi:serine/threonine-protein kinase